jgi:two-component system chemotaxis response regulator CheB
LIRLLVADDSAFMRIAIRKMVEADPRVQVVGEARNGAEAVELAEKLNPHVITMDVEMPGMDGLAATAAITSRRKCPIIMVSSMTEEGAATTLKALASGAVDFIPKKSSMAQLDIAQIGEDLLKKVRYWAERSPPANSGGIPAPAALPPGSPACPVRPAGELGLVLAGVSTGGPATLLPLLKAMGPLPCPMVIAQHMPPLFTRTFADHLARDTGLEVVEGTQGMPLAPGLVVISPGGTDSLVRENHPGRLTLLLRRHDDMPVHPSADVLFLSAAGLSVEVAAVILTGMGNDGAKGALELRRSRRNCPVLVQEPATCVVDGMPASALQAGAATEALAPEEIGRRLAEWGKRAETRDSVPN